MSGRARVELRQYDEKEITGFHPGVSLLTYATPPPLGQVIRSTRFCSPRNSVFILFPVETDYYPRTTNIRRTVVISVPKPSDTVSPPHTHPHRQFKITSLPPVVPLRLRFASTFCRQRRLSINVTTFVTSQRHQTFCIHNFWDVTDSLYVF